MSYFRATTDASDCYRPNSSAAGAAQPSTAVSGNLADMMRNATVVRVAFVVPAQMHLTTAVPGIDLQGFYGAT
jgi:hypothetical protein